MTDNIATMQGYTKQVMAEAEDGSATLFLLVKPDYDMDAKFKAWDTDVQEWLYVNGYNFAFHSLED